MKASELRIGNLLYFSNGIKPNEIIRVGRRFFSSAAIEKEDGDFEITNYYRGIPLTEEWLLRFGMDEALNGWWCKDEVFSYHEGYAGLGISRWTQIQYVHQLQNLYFALTGQELTIKEATK